MGSRNKDRELGSPGRPQDWAPNSIHLSWGNPKRFLQAQRCKAWDQEAVPRNQGFYSPVNRLPPFVLWEKTVPGGISALFGSSPNAHFLLTQPFSCRAGICGNCACSPLLLPGKAWGAWKFYVSPQDDPAVYLSPLRIRALLEGMIWASQKGLDDTGLGVILRPSPAGRGSLPVSSGSDTISLEPVTSG